MRERLAGQIGVFFGGGNRSSAHYPLLGDHFETDASLLHELVGVGCPTDHLVDRLGIGRRVVTLRGRAIGGGVPTFQLEDRVHYVFHLIRSVLLGRTLLRVVATQLRQMSRRQPPETFSRAHKSTQKIHLGSKISHLLLQGPKLFIRRRIIGSIGAAFNVTHELWTVTLKKWVLKLQNSQLFVLDKL